ncbi:GDSL esterase/lipase 7-like isoform X1 [Tasmannia lanceolata]|uniref:GDSL esterase/lipase 7-like isoform X1 n=1 Tax=Tasmannia lanceolata TaxID=3420 RepID=UPI004062A7FD
MRKSSVSIFFPMFLFHFLSVKSEQPLVPALYVFGDSLSDSGNNNFLNTTAKVNYSPYGIDFVPAGPTGRFTNGKTAVDFGAEFLGLPFPPPYLGLSKVEKCITTKGVNYASGSAGILTETGVRLGERLYLEKQLHYFQKTVKIDLRGNFPTSEALSAYLAKAIFTVNIGSNDYINNYLQPDFYISSKIFTPEAFANLLITKLSHSLTRLYALGARKFVVSEIGPIGCIPIVVNSAKTNGCVQQVNQLVSLFNDRLPTMLHELKSFLPGSIFVRSAIFALSSDIQQNPSTYGFTDTRDACCILGGNGTTLCIPNQPPCENRNQYVYWDAFHPTQAVDIIAAMRCFNQSTLCSPINIQQLVQA